MRFEEEKNSMEEIQVKFLTKNRIPQKRVCQIMKKKNSKINVYLSEDDGGGLFD